VGVLKPIVDRYLGKISRIYFPADAAFVMPDVYEFVEAERIKPHGADRGAAKQSSATPTSPIRQEAGPSRAG
jgi:hypothetical protein